MAQRQIHISGIGGVGMSALAQLLVDTGYQVSGSDRFHDQGTTLPVLQRLRAGGVTLAPQDGSAISANLAALVFSTAVESDNPERVAAESLGVPVRHRAEVLAEEAQKGRVIGVAGTAGKTTTTAMLAWLLAETGFDPIMVNGGAVPRWNTPERVGSVRAANAFSSETPWIVEVDESDRSLLRFRPEVSILTNVSRDHFDLEETWALFRTYADQVQGTLVHPPALSEHLKGVSCSSEAVDATFDVGPRSSTITWRGEQWTCPLPGHHNAENAALAWAVARGWGADPDALRNAFLSFPGIERRLQRMPSRDGLVVFDDYAHNPAKIGAAWRTAQAFGERVCGIWRPHGFGPLAAMEDDLVAMWADEMGPEDRLWVLPVFYAGGTAGAAQDSDRLVERLRDKGVKADWVPNIDAAADAVRSDLRDSGDVALVLGARDPRLPELASRIGAN